MLKKIGIAVVLIAVSLSAAANDDILPELKKGQPKEVKALIDRIYTCNHFAGEEGYDRERRAELNAAMRQNRCAQVETDEAKMVARYKNNRKVVHALNAAKAPSAQVDADP
jgi:hypothetical protein